ncbi:MAG: bestrophin family ion channel [Bacteroidota bacterium]
MITYNPKDWFTLILKFHKSDTFRILLPSLFFIGVYAAAIVFSEAHFFHIETKNPTVMHSILGFVLSMLLVFRTNSAYDRWWEGRKLWGSFVNNSRNLGLKLSVLVTDKSDREDLRLLITNYVYSAKNHLRNKYIQDEFIPVGKLELSNFADANHKPNLIAKALYAKINELHQNKILESGHLLILNEELKSFTDNVGACERIKNTPIPYSYNIFLKKMIFLYIMSLPIFFGSEFGYTTVPVTVIVLYVFASIELIAEEIEDPFGEDDNDLPLDDICGRIKNNLNEIFN